MTAETEQSNQPEPRQKRSIIIFLAIIAVLGITGCGFLYNQHSHDQKLLNDSGATTQADQQKLVKQVSRLMVLPANEQPTIATVSDSHKLPNQTFFQHASNGDKVLIYAKAKTAILYDPEQNLILAVSPLNIKSAKSSTE